jgi:hypothetical protein
MIARLATMSVSLVASALAFEIIASLKRKPSTTQSSNYTYPCDAGAKHRYMTIYPLLGAGFNFAVIFDEFLFPAFHGIRNPLIKLGITMLDVVFIALTAIGLAQAADLLTIYGSKEGAQSKDECPRAAIHTYTMASVAIVAVSLFVWLAVFALTMIKLWWKAGLTIRGLPSNMAKAQDW